MLANTPAHLHFIWIGARLPWFCKLAIQSALHKVPKARVTLWASHDLTNDPHAQALSSQERFEVLPLDETTLFSGAPKTLPVDALARLLARLTSPVARANIARLVVLARFGGVYLDTDTVTVCDLEPLYALGAFCGLEHVVWPFNKKRSGLHAYRLLGGPVRSVVRDVCANVHEGERMFRHVAPWYDTAANNAVLGFPAGHPFLLRTLARAAELSEAELHLRYRLGTHLLQQMLAECGDELGVHQLPPRYFYPLGPEISRQYFRPRGDARAATSRIVRPDTHVVHWYASLAELERYDEERVMSERHQTVFAQLAAAALAPPAQD